MRCKLQRCLEHRKKLQDSGYTPNSRPRGQGQYCLELEAQYRKSKIDFCSPSSSNNSESKVSVSLSEEGGEKESLMTYSVLKEAGLTGMSDTNTCSRGQLEVRMSKS
jgi:hypothetical protein